MTDNKIVKLSVNLSSDIVEAIRTLAKKRDTTMTGVIRQAIGNEKYLDEAIKAGGKILIEDKNGKIRQVVFK